MLGGVTSTVFIPLRSRCVDEGPIRRVRGSLLGSARVGVVQTVTMAVEQLDVRLSQLTVCVIRTLADELEANGSGCELSITKVRGQYIYPKDLRKGVGGLGLYSERNQRMECMTSKDRSAHLPYTPRPPLEVYYNFPIPNLSPSNCFTASVVLPALEHCTLPAAI